MDDAQPTVARARGDERRSVLQRGRQCAQRAAQTGLLHVGHPRGARSLQRLGERLAANGGERTAIDTVAACIQRAGAQRVQSARDILSSGTPPK